MHIILCEINFILLQLNYSIHFMPIFKYKIIDSEGKTIESTLEAKDKFALYHTIKKEGTTIVSAEEVKNSPFSFSFSFFGSVKAHDKIIFARNLGAMLDAGLPITRGLSIMERESKGELKWRTK